MASPRRGSERSGTLQEFCPQDAERRLVSAEAAKQRGDWVDPALGRTTFGEWAERWLESKRNLKPKTRYGYRNLLDTRILPTFETTRLNRLERLDVEQVEQWVSAMVSEGLSASRIRQAQLRHSSIRATFDVYGHLFPGHLDDVVGRLDAAFREILTAPRRPQDGPEAPGTLFAAP